MMTLIPIMLAVNQNQTEKGQEILDENAASNETNPKSKDVNMNVESNNGTIIIHNNDLPSTTPIMVPDPSCKNILQFLDPRVTVQSQLSIVNNP